MARPTPFGSDVWVVWWRLLLSEMNVLGDLGWFKSKPKRLPKVNNGLLLSRIEVGLLSTTGSVSGRHFVVKTLNLGEPKKDGIGVV